MISVKYLQKSAVQLNTTHINCLMYADDVVLLSETSNGLQNCLNKLSTYCKQ